MVREQLATGGAQVAGTMMIDGTSLYRVDLPHGLAGYFDRTNYRLMYLDDPQGDGSVVRLRVIAYEQLPLTSQNEKLLSLTAQHPNARIDTNPNDAPGGK